MSAENSAAPVQTSAILVMSRWQQIAIFATLVTAGLFALQVVKSQFQDSPQAASVKQRLRPLADQLDESAKVGYLINANALNDGVAEITGQYNALPQNERDQVNASDLKYCLIAAFHLADGIDEVAMHKSWLSRGKYEAAVSVCK